MTGATDLLVVGAGPTGLTLALQAHDHGARVRIVDRRPEAFRPSRALILHPRTLEVLRPLGVAEAVLAKADVAPEANLHVGDRSTRVRLAGLALPDTPFPPVSLVRQMEVETILAGALAARGIAVERGTELIAAASEVAGARALLRSRLGSQEVACSFVVGCDGPESTVRRCAGIAWRGGPYGEAIVLADAELDTDLAAGIAHAVVARRGLLLAFTLGERATWRLLATQPAGRDPSPFGQPGADVPLAELQALLDGAGLKARITALAWSARYRVQHRLAAQFRRDRLFLAGDAAHAFSPASGQGMNTGMQDAANLGWKLAFAAAATDRAALLDSYERERRPLARRVLAITHLAFLAESSTSPLPAFLRGVLAPLGAPALPGLVARRSLIARALCLVTQMRAAYRDSPISLEERPWPGTGRRAGQLLPDALAVVEGLPVRLHGLLARPGIQALLHRDSARIEQLDFGPHVTLHRVASAPGTALVAVRPDGYVGFRSQVADAAQFRAWLARVGAI
jgi:2-polyprenyl-6-methoxyphenol hydroxylase-like FAD-dependent oxidoreductase